nr:PREDICTED: uncharacterized protein LOC109042110 [Bemisia tabaci]
MFGTKRKRDASQPSTSTRQRITQDETSLSEKDKMPVSIFRTRTIWRGTKTKDVIVPQANFPRINLHVEEESKGLYFYNDKLKVVTCGRTLKSMMPTPVYEDQQSITIYLEKYIKKNLNLILIL